MDVKRREEDRLIMEAIAHEEADRKKWKVVIKAESCPYISTHNICMVCEAKRAQCNHENCPSKHITRPDPAEVEMIVDDCLRRYSLAHLALEDAVEENLYQEDIAECNERMDKARADLLKLVGGGNE